MRPTVFWFICTGLATLVQTASSETIPKGSFKVTQVQRPEYVPNGEVTPEQRSSHLVSQRDDHSAGEAAEEEPTMLIKRKKRQSGIVKATPDIHDLYPIKVGGKEFLVKMNTASPATWVFSTYLSRSLRGNHSIYDSSKLKGHEQIRWYRCPTFKTMYDDGSYCSGELWRNTVEVAGLAVKHQEIGLPDHVSQAFLDGPADGELGLSIGSVFWIWAGGRRANFFDYLTNDLPQPVFTAQLRDGRPGIYEFGHVDELAYLGNLTTVPINNTIGLWEFDSFKFLAGNKSIEVPGNRAIADTSSEFIRVKELVSKAYWAQVPGAYFNQDSHHWYSLCDVVLPDLEVAVGPTYMAKVPGKFLMHPPQFMRASPVPGDYCLGAVQAGRSNESAVYGKPWFKSQFVAFHLNPPDLSVAPLRYSYLGK